MKYFVEGKFRYVRVGFQVAGSEAFGEMVLLELFSGYRFECFAEAVMDFLSLVIRMRGFGLWCRLRKLPEM